MGNHCCKPLCLWLFILVALFLRVNETLSEALPLVSLIQGDNSLYITHLSLGDIASEQCVAFSELCLRSLSV